LEKVPSSLEIDVIVHRNALVDGSNPGYPWWKMLTYSMRVSSQKKKSICFFSWGKKHHKTMGLPMVSKYVQS
jgi:hypothetical protein